MLSQKDYSYNSFVFIVIVLTRLYFLQELASFTAVFPHKASCISHEELPILVPEFSSSYVGVVLLIMQLGEYFF